MKGKYFCPVCGKIQNFTSSIKKIHYKDEDYEFDYDEQFLKCDVCNEALYTDENNKYNQDVFEETLKVTQNLITIEEINAIILKYRISKRNLSLVLGLGEITITRYLEGATPIKRNSALLRSVLNDPVVYYNYLKKNKDKIKEFAYKKSKTQLDSILHLSSNDKKLEEVADYIIINNDQTTPLELQKLLYYSEVFANVLLDSKLFNSTSSCLEHGPVYGHIYYEYKEFENMPIEKDNTYDENVSFNKEIVDAVIKYFGCYSGKVLSYFTHSEEPWINAKKNNSDIISDDDIKAFARRIKEEYKIEKPKDIRKYSEAMFNKYKETLK